MNHVQDLCNLKHVGFSSLLRVYRQNPLSFRFVDNFPILTTIRCMIWQLLEIFFNVIAPVFVLVGIGYAAGQRLGLEARTLSRYAYFILVPIYVFNVISTAVIEADLAVRMITYIIVVHLMTAVFAYAVARFGKRPPPMIAAYILIAVFGNTGNFGLALNEFRLGADAVVLAAIYMLALTLSSFVIGVIAANWQKGKGGLMAVTAVLKTPAIIAIAPALLVNWTGATQPLMLTRITGLVSGAMIPTMLITLGVQLSASKSIKINRDIVTISAIRLLIAPLLAILLAIPFAVSGLPRDVAFLQSAMPAAVLTTIIAMEHDLIPDFVTTAVLFTTIASVITLTFLMALL